MHAMMRYRAHLHWLCQCKQCRTLRALPISSQYTVLATENAAREPHEYLVTGGHIASYLPEWYLVEERDVLVGRKPIRMKRRKRRRVRRSKPVKRTGSAMPIPTTSREWFTRMYPLMRWIIRRKLRRYDYRLRDEALATSLCHTVAIWDGLYRRKHKTIAPLDAARIVASKAAKRAWQPYSSTRTAGYVDALDHAEERASIDDGLAAAPRFYRAQYAPVEVEDMTIAKQAIATLPSYLQGVAFCYSANSESRKTIRSLLPEDVRGDAGLLTQAEIAAYCGVSVRTVRNYTAEIRAVWEISTDEPSRNAAAMLAEWLGQ